LGATESPLSCCAVNTELPPLPDGAILLRTDGSCPWLGILAAWPDEEGENLTLTESAASPYSPCSASAAFAAFAAFAAAVAAAAAAAEVAVLMALALWRKEGDAIV
jgi:hypothetical protein